MSPSDPHDPQNEPRAEYASKKGEVVLRPHEFDGIQEYDQKLPNWWLFIFFASIVFFFGYWLVYYNFNLIGTDKEAIEKQLTLIEQKKKDALGEMLAKLNDKVLVNEFGQDPDFVAAGKELFTANCIACHGQNLTAAIDLGGGQSVNLPGLSLVDGTWKYGPKPMDIFKLINEGTPADSPGHNGAKMEAWGQKLPPIQVAQLTAYLLHENPKEFPVAP